MGETVTGLGSPWTPRSLAWWASPIPHLMETRDVRAFRRHHLQPVDQCTLAGAGGRRTGLSRPDPTGCVVCAGTAVALTRGDRPDPDRPRPGPRRLRGLVRGGQHLVVERPVRPGGARCRGPRSAVPAATPVLGAAQPPPVRADRAGLDRPPDLAGQSPRAGGRSLAPGSPRPAAPSSTWTASPASRSPCCSWAISTTAPM